MASFLRAAVSVRSRKILRRAVERAYAIETLEERRLLATVTLNNNVMIYTAGNQVANNLVITETGTAYSFNDTGETITTAVAGASGSGTNTVTVPKSGATSLLVSVLD